MPIKVLPCIDCGKEESYDCELYLCMTSDGFLVVVCIMYAVMHNLTILQKMRLVPPEDEE